MARPRALGRWDYQPPFPGFSHTVLPLFGRNLMVVSDESIRDGAEDWPKLVWILDVSEESKPTSISTCPRPPVKAFARRGGRFGAHNLHGPFDIGDPFRPQEVAWGDAAGAAGLLEEGL